MKKLSALIMSIIVMMALVSCGGGAGGGDDASGSEGAEGGEATVSVVLEIDYPDESGVADVEDAAVEIVEGGSVLAALNAYAEANDCEVVMSDSSEMLYISSIGGVAETDTAGWVYEVNDEAVMKTADECFLKAGDEVSWSFETWGED